MGYDLGLTTGVGFYGSAFTEMRGITLADVAAAAGVSLATASRVLNGDARVSDGTRQAVRQSADRLGYVPNQAARTLVTGRTDSVALVIPEPNDRFFSDPYFEVLIHGITEVVTTHDLHLVMLAPQSTGQEERVERYLAQGHVDGAMLVSFHGQDALPQRLVARGLPLVMGGRPNLAGRINYVEPDNTGGAREGTAYLASGGRRRIATITGPLDRTSALDRRDGFRGALAEAGLEQSADLEEEAGEYTAACGEEAMRRLLDRRPDLDAVFCASDFLAVGALRAIFQARRAVPSDVAVVGFDDAPAATLCRPRLTTIRQPVEEMGREMARLLLATMADPGATGRHLVLATELIVRESTGEPEPAENVEAKVVMTTTE